MRDRDTPSPAEQPAELPEHESAVRRLASDAHGQEYRPLRSLAEAQATSDGVVVFEGDYGGQIYLTCPASMVRCDESSLQTLLTDIDTLAFRDPPSARIYYERHAVSTGIWGGMGGGIVTGSLWVHPRLEAEHPKIVAGVSEVLAARRARLSLAAG